jgi:pimeloyl-ACP methyl ester carboxylesterase
MHQQVQYCTTGDGVRLAYSRIGKGTPLLRTPHWFAHLDHDTKNRATKHVLLGLAHRHTLVRYDPRGVGLSQRDIKDISFDLWVSDLETVVDSAGLERFILFGLSQGVAPAIVYAARHPERLSHLILYGGFARGLLHRDNPEKGRQAMELGCALIREGWGSEEESHREFFTSQFMPDASKDDHRALNDLQRAACAPEIAERYFRTTSNYNAVDFLAKVATPTLVMHARGDLRVPFSLGQEIAAGIPGAKFVPLESRNHMLPASDPALRESFNAIATFLGEKPLRGALPGTAGLRERLESRAKALEQNWFIKIVIVVAAITGCFIFGLELWKLWKLH